MSAYVYRGSRTTAVKNLGWFFRKASRTPVEHITMTGSEREGWIMEATFSDGERFSTPYASMLVFRETMARKASRKSSPLRGVVCYVEKTDGTQWSFPLETVADYVSYKKLL